MTEGAAPTSAALITLPPSVISRADISRMLNDLERVDNELTSDTIRSKTSGEVAKLLPTTSDQLGSFVRDNGIQLTDATVRAEVIKKLHSLKDSAPIIHMTFAVEADRESLQQLAFWLRKTIHPQAVIAVGLQPGLVAGVYLRTTNKVFDLSLKGALKGRRSILEKELGALRGRA